jgi:GT2 family glycosyltransferase
VLELKVSSPLVSIIVVNYNGKKYLHECLTSLLNQTYRNFEIILVDNKSSDDSVKFVQSNFGNRILVTQNDTNLGFAAGCNIGIKRSKGSLIALFNQDAIADKEWLSTLVYVVQSAEDIAAAAGKVYYWGDKYGKDIVFCTWSKVDPYTAGAYNFYKGDEPMSKVDYLTGAAMLVKKEVIDKIGLLDPEYFLYFDETEWCARMIRASYDLVYVPQAVTWHVVSASLSDSNLKLYHMNRSRMRFALKNFDLRYLPLYLAFYCLESIYDLTTALRHKNSFALAKIRVRVLVWNLIHLCDTVRLRRADFKLLQNCGRPLRSYNKSLPLRDYKIGRLEQYLNILGI